MNKNFYLKTQEEIFHAFTGNYDNLINMLKNREDYDAFAIACNYISYSPYTNHNLFREQIGYDGYNARNNAIKIANETAYDAMGPEFSDLYYMIMDESGNTKKSFEGNELYKLFAYGSASWETKSCIRSALTIHAMIHAGVTMTSAEPIRAVTRLVKNPPYGQICKDGEKDRIVWYNISKYLFGGQIKDAHYYAHSIVMEEHDKH